MIYIVIFIVLLIYLFLIINSIIWLKNKNMVNINDKVIRYIIYIDFIFFTILLLILIYLYLYNLSIKIL